MHSLPSASEAHPSSSDDFWKRFQKKLLPHFPAIRLDGDGTIRQVTRAARRLLEYKDNQIVDPCFFAHVHGRNLGRVMRDLASMVRHGTSRTTWLLRLQTGTGRWRWFRVHALLHPDPDTNDILLRLHRM